MNLGGDAGAEGDGGRWLTCRHAGSGRGEGGNQASTACSCRGGGRVCAVELAGQEAGRGEGPRAGLTHACLAPPGAGEKALVSEPRSQPWNRG